MSRFLLICLGGALGTGARYLISCWSLKLMGPAFPYGTLAVNLLGSFLIAALMYMGTEAALLSETTRLFLTTGILGGFTTYSAFSYETLRYFQVGSWHVALLYVVATVLGCLAACLLGWTGARSFLGA